MALIELMKEKERNLFAQNDGVFIRRWSSGLFHKEFVKVSFVVLLLSRGADKPSVAFLKLVVSVSPSL